jgi:hypothetical protein
LKDENDSVKIASVSSSIEVCQQINNADKIVEDILPSYMESIEKKFSWRLRFGIAEKAVLVCPYISKEANDEKIIEIYEKLLQDSEPEVRSEACNQLKLVVKHCCPD